VPALTDHAIVLRTWDFSETSQTVSLLTRDHGIIRALAKGSRRPRSNFDGGLELLTRGHIAAIIKPTSELAALTEWGLAEIFPHLRTSLAAHRAAFFFADLVHHLFQPNDPHPRLFDAMLDALRALACDTRNTASVLAFLWSTLAEAGYAPIIDRNAATDDPLQNAESYAFSAVAGGLVPDPGPTVHREGSWRLRADTRSVLSALRREEPIPQGESPIRAARLLTAYAEWIIGRSLDSGSAWAQIAPVEQEPVDPK